MSITIIAGDNFRLSPSFIKASLNAEAEASGKIQLQQRVWNLFGKGEVFSKLITNDIIFKLMSKLLGSEFICGSYCASRLLPGSPGQELHIDYPYWDYYKTETFPKFLFPILISFFSATSLFTT